MFSWNTYDNGHLVEFQEDKTATFPDYHFHGSYSDAHKGDHIRWVRRIAR